MMHVGHKIAEFQGLTLFAELSSNVPWMMCEFDVLPLINLLHGGISPSVAYTAQVEALPARIHYVVTAPTTGGAA